MILKYWKYFDILILFSWPCKFHLVVVVEYSKKCFHAYFIWLTDHI